MFLIKNLDLIFDYELYYSTCYLRVNPSIDWTDNRLYWIFDWNKVLNDIEKAETNLPKTLIDPKRYEIRADFEDLLILKELERDATTSFKELSKKLGLPYHEIRYHYYRHIVEKEILEDFEIYVKRFDFNESLALFLITEFTNLTNLAKFANIIRELPIGEVMGKVIGQNKLLSYIYLPYSEMKNLLTMMNILAETGYIKRYKYYMQFLHEKAYRQSIPYKLFDAKDRKWIYKHDLYMQMLHEDYMRIKRLIQDSKSRFN